jgi:hypothetical protein
MERGLSAREVSVNGEEGAALKSPKMSKFLSGIAGKSRKQGKREHTSKNKNHVAQHGLVPYTIVFTQNSDS